MPFHPASVYMPGAGKRDPAMLAGTHAPAPGFATVPLPVHRTIWGGPCGPPVGAPSAHLGNSPGVLARSRETCIRGRRARARLCGGTAAGGMRRGRGTGTIGADGGAVKEMTPAQLFRKFDDNGNGSKVIAPPEPQPFARCTHNPRRAPHTHALSHTRRKCLVPNAFTHSLRSLAHLNRGQCQTLRTCPGLRI